MDESTNPRIIPSHLKELLVFYMDFLKKNKDVFRSDNEIFTFFHSIKDILCSYDYDAVYQVVIDFLLKYVIAGLEHLKEKPQNQPSNLSYQLVFNESNKKSLYNQLTQIASKIDKKLLSSDDYYTVFDAVKVILDYNLSFQIRIPPDFKYMDSENLALYLQQSEETKSKFSADDYKDIVDCFSSVIVENDYYKAYLKILKNKKGNTKKEETEYNEQCKILYDKLEIRVFDCMKEKNPNRNTNHRFDNEDKYLKQIWFSFISSAAIDKKSLLSSRYSESTKFINMIKKQVELESEYKVQEGKLESQPDMSQQDLMYYSPISGVNEHRSSPQLQGKTPLKSNHISSEVTTFATNFKEVYDDISSLAYVPIEDILLLGKPGEGIFIQSKKNADEMLETFKDLLSKNRMSLQDMASKRKSFFQSDFMKKMLEIINLIMTQSDLMHDIILKNLSGVWDQCGNIYKTLRLALDKAPGDSNKSTYLQKIDEFRHQLDACWSQGSEGKAIQEKIRFLRQSITNWLIEIVKLPRQDFEKQVFNREESIIYCLNFYGEHKPSNFVFRESGRPVLDFIKIKKLIEDFDEPKKKDFMSKLTKEGKDLLDYILYNNKDDIEKLEKMFISEPNTLSVIDGCLKKDFDHTFKQHTFKTMFGIYEYTVSSNIKKNQIDAASVGHLIVIRNTQQKTVAVYGLVGSVTVNNILDTYYKMGGLVKSGVPAGRGSQKGKTNLFQGNIFEFSTVYGIDISSILPEIENYSLKQKYDNHCNYFRINLTEAFDDNEIFLLTLGIKTICDEVLDVNGDKVKLVITVDSLVWDTILKKWLTGDKIVLPYVFRSFSRSYFMNSGKLEANVEFISKEIFIKILKYCQLAKSLAYINESRIRIVTDINTTNNLSRTLITLTEQFLTSLGSDSILNQNFTVNRYVNAIYRICKLLIMPIDEFSHNNAYDNCSGFIMKLNASNVYNNLLTNIRKMNDFLSSFVNSRRSQPEIELFVDNINSLAGDQNLLRITEVNQYHESQTTSYPNDLIDAVGTNYGVLIKIADVTETGITFYTGGETVDLKKALKSNEIDFDIDNVDISCEKMYNGRQTVETIGKPITFHIVEYTYSIEFLIKILENGNGFDIHPSILEKIQYFCIKYFVNNYEMVKQNDDKDEDFLNLLNIKFKSNIFTDVSNYLDMKKKLEEVETHLPEKTDDECDYGDGAKPKKICPPEFTDWIDSHLENLFILESVNSPPIIMEVSEDIISDDPIQQSINNMSRLIMTNCNPSGQQTSQKIIDSKERFDVDDLGEGEEFSYSDMFDNSSSSPSSPILTKWEDEHHPVHKFASVLALIYGSQNFHLDNKWGNNNEFNQQLQPLGLQSFDVESDGSCFFHAVEAQLINAGKPGMDFSNLRQTAIDHLTHNKIEIKPFLDKSDDKSVDAYIARMSRSETWADEVAIRALAKSIGINILIINNRHVNNPAEWTFISCEVSTAPTITIGHIGELHYTSIVSISEEGTNLLNQIFRIHSSKLSNTEKRQALSKLTQSDLSDIRLLSSNEALSGHQTSRQEEKSDQPLGVYAPETGLNQLSDDQTSPKKKKSDQPLGVYATDTQLNQFSAFRPKIDSPTKISTIQPENTTNTKKKSRINRGFDFLQRFWGNKPPGGGRPSTRRRRYKVKRFTKGRIQTKKTYRKTRKTYRKKYKTRRR